MRILVCGGRHYGDKPEERRRGFEVLAEVCQSGDEIIHGGATGGDTLADDYANEHGLVVRPFPVDHTLDGPWPAAGPRRNKRMYESSKPHLVIALPGGRGTASMVAIARAGGTYVLEVE